MTDIAATLADIPAEPAPPPLAAPPQTLWKEPADDGLAQLMADRDAADQAPPTAAPADTLASPVLAEGGEGPLAPSKYDYSAVGAALDKRRDENIRAMLAIKAARGTSPDEAAKAFGLAKETNLPTEIVARNLKEVDALNLQRKYAWVADSPAVQKFLSDPVNAQLAAAPGDYEKLGLLEQLGVELKRAALGAMSGFGLIGSKMAGAVIGDLDTAIALKQSGEYLTPYYKKLIANEAQIRAEQGERIKRNWAQHTKYRDEAATLPELEAMKEFNEAGDKGDTDAAMAAFLKAPWAITQRSLIGGLASMPVSLAAAAVGTAAGGPGTGAIAGGLTSGGMEYAGAIMDVMKDLKIDIADPEAVQRAFADPAIMKQIEQRGTLKALAIGLVDAGSFGLASIPLKLLGWGARPAVRTATGMGTQMVMQGAAGAGGDALGNAVAGLPFNFASGFQEFVGEFAGGPLEVAAARGNLNDVKAAFVRDRINEISALPPVERDAATTVFAVERMIEIANTTKLSALAPDKLIEFMQRAGQEEQTVFVPANVVATYMQDMTGIERPAFLERLGISEQQIERARVSKEDIAIPLPNYVMNVGEAHKAWRDDIRTEVEGFSVNQAKDYEKTRTAETQAIIQRFEEGLAAGVQLEPRQIVQDKAFAQLKEMGLPTRQAASNAALLAGHANAMATLEPTKYADALDFYEKHPIRFESENTRRVRELAPDRLDILLDSIRSGKDPLSPPVPDAHVKARADAAALELTSVLGPGPEKTPAQIAKENRKAAQELFKADRENLAGMLAEMGVDPKGMSNAEIRSALEGAASGQGRTYNEAGVPKQSLSDSLIMVAQRGDRTVGNRLLLSPAEKAAIKASVGPANMSEREITETVRKHKLAHPPAQGWEPLVFVRARLDDNGKPEFQYQQVPYGFIKGNDGKEIKPDDKRYAARVKAIGDAMAEEVRSVYRRAQAGDKNAQNILAQAGWYKAMRTRLRQEFGALGDLFADALGATSPNTPVRGNWENAVDSLRLASRGDFDALIPKWVAWAENVEKLETDLRAFVNEQRAQKQASKIEPWMDSDKPQTLKSIKVMQEYIDKRKALSEARELPEDLMPKKESGAKYGFNGKNVVRAMLDMWRTIKDADPNVGRGGTAPKALNFSGNLIGFRGKATIDVWAARLLQRLAGKRRIPSMAEATVSGEMLSDASTTKQFGFGQAAFDHAVDVIRGDGEMKQDNALATINADDLQAVVWFIEKEVWTVNNWTSVAGEGGSFELEANLTGTAKQDRVRELRKIIDSSPATADTRAVAASAEAAAAVEAWDAEHKAQIDELGEINRRLAEEAGTLSKKDASGLKKRAAELQKIIKLPAKLAKPMRDAQNGQRRIDELAASKIAARSELSSLERTVDRYVGGLSTQMSIDNQGVDYVPTDADMARLGEAIRLAIYENDATANVLASKALATEGRYGSAERSLDLEIVAREGYDPSTVWAEMLRQAQAARQDSTFLSRVLRDGEAIDYTKHRPGIEIYFRDAAAAQQLETMLADLAKEGVSFLTVAVDGRRMPGYVAGAMPPAVGVRLQYVPEFEQRYGIDDLLGLDDEAIASKIKSKGHEMQDVAMAVAANVSGVSFSGVFWHETEVAFSHQYQEKIDGLATGIPEGEPGSTRGEAGWVGQSVRAGLENADSQSREAASRESDVQREPVVGGDETGPGANQQGVTLNQEARGSITFDNTGALVRTFAGRDPSTVLHELWHYFHNNLEFMARAPDASSEVKAMYQATLDYAGVKGGNLSLTPAEWDRYRALGDKIKKSGKGSLDGGETAEWTVLLGRVEQNEVVARAGEAFLLIGKSPSEALASAFRAFKNWLISVYRSVKRLNVPVSAEFDAVMAQMIATREEIEAAQNRQGLNPVLGDAKNMLTEAERDAYTKRAEQVLEEADDKVRAKVMAPLSRAAKSLVDDVTGRIKGEVTAEAMKDPGNAALYLLRNGKLFGSDDDAKRLPIKLSRPALVAIVGEDGLKNLPTGIHADDGMDLTTVAQMVGLGNGQELVERLMQVQTDQKRYQDDGGKGRYVDDQIHRETHRRVLEEIGDPLNDGSLEKEVEDAIRSDKQGALMAFELKVLARKAGHSGVVSLEDITAWADGAIAEMSQYQAVQFAKYQRAERTAGIKVQQALLKGDIVAAFKAKQDQLVNFALYKAAKKAAEDTDKITGYLDKLAGARTIKALDQDYLDTIHEMLEEYDFKRRSGPLLAERTLFNAYKAEQLERGVVVQEPPRLKGAERKHFSQMSMEELRDFYDTIKQIDRLGRKKKELFLDGKKRELEATLTEMEAAAAAGVQRGSSLSTRGLSDLEKTVGKPKHWLRVMNAELLKVERLLEFADGDKTGRGIFTRMIYRPVADAAAATNDRRIELGKKQKAIYEKVPEAQRHSWAELHVLPELGGIKLDKEAIIAIALNMGNASNLEKMLLGEKWTEDGVRAAVNKHLTQEEWTFVQDMWDLIDSQWPEAAAMIRDVEGVEPPKIEAVPLQTPYGTLKGGYYPVEYARNESLKGDKVGEMQDSALLVGMAPSPRYGRPSSKAGSTNARTEFNAPFNLSLSVIGKHLDEITHDIFHRRAVADIFKIVSNDRFREAIRSRLGAEYEKVFMPWLKRVANEARQNNSDLRGWDSAMKTLRVNVTMMAMGLRVSTMVQQVAGYANSLQRLGSKDMLAGMAEFWPNPGRAAEQVYALSGEMRHRANNLERDVKANLDKFRGKSTWKASLGRFAFRGIALADLSVSIPTWLGAYRKGLADGFDEADAISYADKMVRDTQGAGGSKDLSSFQDGSETWKIMGMFYSFLNVFYNAQQGIVEDARKPNKSFSDYADIAWQVSMLMIVSPIMAALLSGQGPDDEEDKLYWAMRQAGFGAFSGIPIVRDLMGTLSRELGGKPSAGFKMSPVAGPLEGSIRLVKDLTNLASGEEVSKNFVKNTFNVVGGFAGLPTGQIGVTSQFLWDSLISGAENPENLLDWMRGMSFGPKK